MRMCRTSQDLWENLVVLRITLVPIQQQSPAVAFWMNTNFQVWSWAQLCDLVWHIDKYSRGIVSLVSLRIYWGGDFLESVANMLLLYAPQRINRILQDHVRLTRAFLKRWPNVKQNRNGGFSVPIAFSLFTIVWLSRAQIRTHFFLNIFLISIAFLNDSEVSIYIDLVVRTHFWKPYNCRYAHIGKCDANKFHTSPAICYTCHSTVWHSAIMVHFTWLKCKHFCERNTFRPSGIALLQLFMILSTPKPSQLGKAREESLVKKIWAWCRILFLWIDLCGSI